MAKTKEEGEEKKQEEELREEEEEEVVLVELRDYSGPNVYYEPTYQTKPDNDEKFSATMVKTIAQDILHEELDGANIDDKWIEEWADFGDDFESLSKLIANKIKNKCKTELRLPRYKILVQVSIGQMKDQGVCITSRCLWDTNTDNYASVSQRNESIWASCIVFGVYTE